MPPEKPTTTIIEYREGNQVELTKIDLKTGEITETVTVSQEDLKKIRASEENQE